MPGVREARGLYGRRVLRDYFDILVSVFAIASFCISILRIASGSPPPPSTSIPYLSWRRLVLGWVVSAGLLGSGCDGPLALLELLGDWAGGRHDANYWQLAVTREQQRWMLRAYQRSRFACCVVS